MPAPVLENFLFIEEIFTRNQVIKTAFEEEKVCIRGIYREAGYILQPDQSTPEAFRVCLGEIPRDFFDLKKNVFSVLFQAVYHLLDIETKRRLLYGQLNHLFRIWVTSADNLLDGEDKIVMPIEICGRARTMRQVISLMLADRIMSYLLDKAVLDGLLTSAEAKILSQKSLQILLPSAAEEASEEEGIFTRPPPAYVLSVIHKLKTGLLFHIPFLGPESIEKNIDKENLAALKEGLLKFGIGCQVLDDIRDLAKDYLEKRHNYILSKIYWQGDTPKINFLKDNKGNFTVSTKIFHYFPKYVNPAAALAVDYLQKGLSILDSLGLKLGEKAVEKMPFLMFSLLDLEELVECIEKKELVLAL